jgi:signal transduction histidine kinase
MRRRITLAILGTVAAALIFAGIGTLALNRVTARASEVRDLRNQAEATAAIVDVKVRGTALTRQHVLQFRNALNLKDVDLVLLGQDNQPNLEVGDPIPPGIQLTAADYEALRNGEIVSGSKPTEAWAAVPLNSTNPKLQGVLFLTRDTSATLSSGVGWFVLASIATLLLGALIAARLSRRLTRPLTDATEATARIADGDLSVRVPEHHEGSTDELDALARSINGMADSLERSRGLERQFLLSVSHDLRTPLTSIRGYAEAIADGAVPDVQQAAGVILAESRRLERLVRDLLDLAKLEGRQFSMQLSPVNLGDLMSDSVDGFRHEMADAGLGLDLHRPPVPVWALADRDRLAQVVANLVENALKYAAHQIDVTVIGDPARPRIAVADDGPGIAPQDLPHVFERLYVAGAQPQRKEIGSGLGLAIVRELVDAMGGSVRAEANPGGGTRMVVSLRPTAAPVVPAGPPGPPLVPPVPPAPSGPRVPTGPTGSPVPPVAVPPPPPPMRPAQPS